MIASTPGFLVLPFASSPSSLLNISASSDVNDSFSIIARVIDSPPIPTVEVKIGMPRFKTANPVRARPKSTENVIGSFSFLLEIARAIERASTSSDSSLIPAESKAAA